MAPLPRILTLDLGNSSAKLALFAPRTKADASDEFLSEVRFATDAGLVLALESFLSEHAEIGEALLSSVVSPGLEGAVCDVLARRFGPKFRRNPAAALQVDYSPPDALGRDRLYAARGACSIAQDGAIVVDAGTALTVDAVTKVRSGEYAGVFRGGSIAPGPRLLADALHRHTARLPRIDPEVGAAACGRDTRSALQSGVVVGFRGAAAELARRIADDVELPGTAPVVVTGGAREFLLRPASCFGDRRVIVEPLLVHRGLIAASRDAR